METTYIIPASWRQKAGGSLVPGQPWLYSKFKVILTSNLSNRKKKKEKKEEKECLIVYFTWKNE